ncbi:phospholipase D family protein [Pseudooceanicola sp.]|uniref:phospholipase D family protein n=1 Tax=Pseudooceanicola sp. TaxID=1914328 RepID=UPI0035C666CA
MRTDGKAETEQTGAGPEGHGDVLRPLITAAEMFPTLENLVLEAQSEVLVAFRVFDATTALHSGKAKDLGLTTWADLLDHVAQRGVTLRLLLSDFDPVFTPDLHRDAWYSAGRFAARLAEFPNVEIIAALHDCAPAPLWEWAFALPIHKRLAALQDMPHERLTPHQHRALKGEYHLRPVTLHQKFAVIDERRAIIGGIDVNERRYDDNTHDQRPEDTWHDVSVEVTGPVVTQLRRHFADCWTRACGDCGTVFSESATPLDLPEPAEYSAQDTAKDTGARGPKILRTLSTRGTGAARFGPVTEVREHETAHLDAFAMAERSIYIETQFLRHLPLARALARRAAEAPELQLIFVIPTEPERVIFGRDRGMTARHAQALQLRCLQILRRAYGDRLAIVSPAQPRPAPDGTPMPVNGSGIIYLHSKVTLVDDRTGIVGSANLNGRSLLWDTEASVQFDDAGVIADLRARLAAKWLGKDSARIETAATWTQAAEEAAQTPPEQRKAMIQPFPESRNRRFARYVPILPDAMF